MVVEMATGVGLLKSLKSETDNLTRPKFNFKKLTQNFAQRPPVVTGVFLFWATR